MSVISILKSFWKNETISVREVSQQFGLSDVDARLRLQTLEDEDVLKEVQEDLFVTVSEKEQLTEAMVSEFQDCIEDEECIEKIAEKLY